MPPSDADILHVSDTALMVAACRALETDRPDGLVRDPFAGQLAGERGMAIAQGLAQTRADGRGLDMMRFGVGIRSRFLDELVLDVTTRRNVAAVLSLGAGLDSRPWRLDLPESLRWIEVDFPAMLDYKGAIMAQHQPKCRLERLSADLNDPSQRSAVFAAAGSAPALMITEGLLMYLPADTIDALAVEPPRMSGIQYWLTDLISTDFRGLAQMDCQSIDNVRAAGHLNGEQILEIALRNGWTSAEWRNYVMDAWQAAPERVQELARNASASGKKLTPPPPGDPSGVRLLARA